MTVTAHVRQLSSTRLSLPREVASELCELCLGFEEQFLRPAGLVWRKHGNRGVPGDVTYRHHRSWATLKTSAEAGCQLCTLLRAGYLAEHHSRRHSKDPSITIEESDSWLSEINNGEGSTCFGLEGSRSTVGFFDYVGQAVVSFASSNTNAPRWGQVRFVLGVEAGSPANIEGQFQGRICPSIPDLELARQWLANCQGGHDACRNPTTLGRPARLIWHSQDGTQVRLIDTNGVALLGGYTALSHRWGARKPVVTERKNLQDRYQSIAIASLPSLFKDAILTTGALGFSYIWIDSLCIVQDDPDDWATECSKMASIYQGSSLTIAAADCPDSFSGFLQDREFLTGQVFRPCPLQYRNADGEPQGEVTMWYPGHPRRDDRRTEHEAPASVLEQQPDSFLDQRGWILQERILSHRILYFGHHQMYFDCMEKQYFELFHYSYPHDDQPATALTKLVPTFTSSYEHHKWWRQIVESYSRCKLTIPRDKLPAIAGIACAFQPPKTDVYLAGLWRSNLPRALLWHRADCREAMKQQPGTRNNFEQPYRAPSWSWASQDFPITCVQAYGQEPSTESWGVKIIKATVELLGTDPFGRVTGGLLRVRGKLRKITVARYDENGAHFSVYATPVDRYEWPVAFYPDDLGPYMATPAAEKSRSTLGYNPTTDEIDAASYPEITALFLGQLGQFSAAALAIQLVPGTEVYRRIGFLDIKYGPVQQVAPDWFEDINEQDLDII